jgi:hypothetical protein
LVPAGRGVRVWDVGFGVWGLGFGVRGLGFGVTKRCHLERPFSSSISGYHFLVRISGFGFRVSGFGFRISFLLSGFGVGVSGFAVPWFTSELGSIGSLKL